MLKKKKEKKYVHYTHICMYVHYTQVSSCMYGSMVIKISDLKGFLVWQLEMMCGHRARKQLGDQRLPN